MQTQWRARKSSYKERRHERSSREEGRPGRHPKVTKVWGINKQSQMKRDENFEPVPPRPEAKEEREEDKGRADRWYKQERVLLPSARAHHSDLFPSAGHSLIALIPSGPLRFGDL